MRHFIAITSLSILTSFGMVQEVKAQDEKSNNINMYVGIFEANINYERNLFQRKRSLGKLRVGLGYGMFWIAGEGNYINGAFVHLFGARNSHLEVNAGAKYMLSNSISDPQLSEQLLPDFFLGYRFEKPTGGVVFRAGFNYLTLLNLGIGYKF